MKIKQANKETIQESKEILEELKEKRGGGDLLSFHKKIANDPKLLSAFNQNYDICIKDIHHIPRKYRELIILALGCSKGVQTTVNTHGRLAYEHGATIEEIGEALRLVFMITGTSGLIPAAELFEELDLEE